jgi:biotin carboxyl carrier protein
MSVLESLYVGVFGMAVVFVVLVGLNLLVRGQSALIALFTGRKVAGAHGADREAPLPEPAPEVPEAAEESTETVEEAPEPVGEVPKSVEVIVSPGPGTVLNVAAVPGAKVRRGELLVLLDAMDMEYEIDATADGTVTQVLTSKGEFVPIGRPLVEIRLEEAQ